MRTFRRILIVLVVVGALLAVADRVASWVGGRVVADQVAAELARNEVRSGHPDVSIGGFPFLTQVAAGEYREVTVQLRDVGTGEARLPEVELTATGVTASMSTLLDRSGAIHADRVEGAGLIDYQSVANSTGLDGLELAAAGGDAVAVRLPVEVVGTTVTLTGSATVSVDGNTLQMRVGELAAEGLAELPAQAREQVDQITRALSVDVPLPVLPYGLRVTTARPSDAGFEVLVAADDVMLSR
ncbi:LmeA family phospholipid-binding protein [Phytoactinopolyspora limicola]|uniref:LmeA family phospholipid-binding protein n=1 Tax=Phytoactinopolyspora limicola TaxID=2715536 RepID=UPI001407FEBA|nr:DUF2993 domain-containing protein [Phytoactinopolyspora limicola]